jgi:hypothetical protein
MRHLNDIYKQFLKSTHLKTNEELNMYSKLITDCKAEYETFFFNFSYFIFVNIGQ